jgi:hypothetical protein
MIRPVLLTLSILTLTLVVSGQHKPDGIADSTKGNTSNEKFEKVDKSAEFPGGLRKFYEYMNQNLNYPKSTGKESASSPGK